MISVKKMLSGELVVYSRGVEAARISGITKEELQRSIHRVEDAMLEEEITRRHTDFLRRTKNMDPKLRDGLERIMRQARRSK